MLKYKSNKSFYKGQIGFISKFELIIDNFVYPLWKEISDCWPGFSFLVENIQTNLSILKVK
jgi:hypothetical protein